MKNLIITILGLVGTIYGACSHPKIEPCDDYPCKLLNLLPTIIILVCILAIVYCVVEYLKNRNKIKRFSLNNKEKINKFLVEKINKSGSIAIFSRDFTWVKEDSIQYEVLKQKSKDGELFLFLEKETNISQKLSNEGAHVKIYSKYTKQGFAPQSRFTILNHKGKGQTTLIGCSDDEEHTIYTLRSKENSELHALIEEYIKLLDLVCVPQPIKRG